MNRVPFASRLLVVLASATFWIGCKTPAANEGTDATAAATPTASASSVATLPGAPVVASPVHAAVPLATTHASAKPTSDASVVAAPLECRAKNADGPIELALSWDKDLAKGTLKSTKAGKVSALPVVAQLYKGLILVDAPGTKNITGALATVTTEGKKTIRLGDYKQPFFDCE